MPGKMILNGQITAGQLTKPAAQNGMPAMGVGGERPVLAIHGTASAGRQWDALREFVSGRPLLAPTMPEQSAKARFDGFVDLISQQSCKIDVVAHSFGGAVAMKLANQIPHSINSLTLYDPVVPMTANASTGGLPFDLWRVWEKVSDASPTETMREFIEYWIGAGAWSKLSKQRHARLIQYAAVVKRDFSQMANGEWNAEELCWAGPINLLYGTQSPAAVAEIGHLMQRTYPQLRLFRLEGLGHMAPLTQSHQMCRIFSASLRHIANRCRLSNAA